MLIRQLSRLRGPTDVEGLELPLVVPITEGAVTLEAGDAEGEYRLRLDRRVGVEGLSLVLKSRTYQIQADGTKVEIPKIAVDELAIAGAESADDVAAVLTFLTDQAFTTYHSPDDTDELLPETPEDEALLRGFGTDEVWMPLSGTPSVRTFREPVGAVLVQALLAKHVGVQLYADAVRNITASARFRDLWRVLESAFGLKGQALIDALAAYPPTLQVDATADELKALHQLRGRASHAESRAGIRELRRVRSAVSERAEWWSVGRTDAQCSTRSTCRRMRELRHARESCRLLKNHRLLPREDDDGCVGVRPSS
jgi:hypothetical protein